MTLKSKRDFAVITNGITFVRFCPLEILRAIKPSQRHAMAGLDKLTADSLEGFLILSDTVKKDM